MRKRQPHAATADKDVDEAQFAQQEQHARHPQPRQRPPPRRAAVAHPTSTISSYQSVRRKPPSASRASGAVLATAT